MKETTEAKMELANNINDTQKDLLNVLQSQGVNTFKFGPHYCDTLNGIFGIGSLLIAILKNHGCQHAEESENNPELRSIVLAHSMTREEIEIIIREVYASRGERYPDSTLRVYLTNHKKGYSFCSFQMTPSEDPTHSTKPHARYYLPE